MRGARYVRLIPWTLHSGSEQLGLKFINPIAPGEVKVDLNDFDTKLWKKF
jgi:hypothetical protein